MTVANVLNFWFGQLNDQIADEMHTARWYQPSQAFDNEVHRLFHQYYLDAKKGKLASWACDSKSCLALIVLLDQMPRNMFRGQAEAFASDELALSICLDGIDRGLDKSLTLIERVFFYHPLEHSENVDVQVESLKQFGKLATEYQGTTYKEVAENAMHWAQVHADIIDKYGRFPHRNDVLGRKSTVEEIEFLESGPRFGQ